MVVYRVCLSLYRGSRWFLAYSLCDACGRLFVKHKFCPVCLKVYRDTEPSPMVCCDSCQKWVHIACDDISEDMYEKFQSEHSMAYSCAACRGTVYKVHPHPEWEAGPELGTHAWGRACGLAGEGSGRCHQGAVEEEGGEGG